MKERDFKGVWIPKSIWLDESLSITEKCLLVEIDSLDNDPEKGCFASNEYLGQFLSLSAGRAANMVSDLKKRGYIEQVFFDGRNRGLRVPMLHENVKNLHENVKAAFTKTGKQPSRFREHSNIDSNTVEIESAPAKISQPKNNTPVTTSQAAPPLAENWHDAAQHLIAIIEANPSALQYNLRGARPLPTDWKENVRERMRHFARQGEWHTLTIPSDLNGRRRKWEAQMCAAVASWIDSPYNKPVSNATPSAGVGISLNDYKPKV